MHLASEPAEAKANKSTINRDKIYTFYSPNGFNNICVSYPYKYVHADNNANRQQNDNTQESAKANICIYC